LRTADTRDTRHELTDLKMDRARQLCPRTSDLDFLCDLECIVDLDAQIANGAFNPVVAQRLGFILRIS
jgi:hypothetical protein